LTEQPSQIDPEILELAQTIMVLKRASEGKTPEPQDVISNLINVRSMFERTGFPTYTILTKAVYLKLGEWYFNHLYGKGEEDKPAKILGQWADFEMQALIAYKRQQRKEAIEMVKRTTEGEETTFNFAAQQGPVKARKRFWQRGGGTKEESEFKES